jgi:putative transposase
MMGRQTGDQSQLFYLFNLEKRIPARAVDHEGEVLEVFATKRRYRRAALKFLKRTMKLYGRPRSIVTDRLRSYRSAMLPIRSAVGGSTIAQKIPPSRSDDENERCRGSGP